MILIQLVWLQNSLLLPVTDKSDSFAQFSFQDEVQERSMMLLLRLIPAGFFKVSHSRIVRVFHGFVKLHTTPAIESKQYALENLRKNINALGSL